jgi:hypothetical protein
VQVNIALVVSREGMPLGYEIFSGNTADVSTVQEIVESMENKFGKVNRVWVMDRGMVSAENIAWLNSTGQRYVIGTPRSELGRFAKQIAEKTDWRQIREDIEVKICGGPDGSEIFLLCRSASRSEKEQAIHERFSNRIEAGLQSLSRRIEKSQAALDRGVLERQIGRLLERNFRASARYSISLTEDKATPAGVKLKWNTRPEWEDWAKLTEGTYILPQHPALGRPRAVEDLHPTERSRSRLPYSQIRSVHPSDLASQTRPQLGHGTPHHDAEHSGERRGKPKSPPKIFLAQGTLFSSCMCASTKSGCTRIAARKAATASPCAPSLA